MAKKPKRMDLPERITVSRNVLMTASDFDAFEMNIIAILLFILRPFMYLADKIPDPGEFFLRFSFFSGRHVKREELVERINKLRLKEVRYRITTPGVNLQVITGLFSSIVVSTGGVLARVTPEAIPWLLYIGRGVGYAQVEPELFLEMSSVYHKRLYLILCSKLHDGIASIVISREKMYKDLGIPEGTPVHDVIERYLNGFQKYLEIRGSIYQFFFESVSRPGPKAGRPSIESFCMVYSVRKECLDKTKKIGVNIESLNLLRTLIPILKKRRPDTMSVWDIHNQLVEKGLDQAFYQAMSAYSKKTNEHQANLVHMILKDRFNIDIFTHDEPLKKN